MRICADGGANRLRDQFPDATAPQTIIGDLDSVRPDVIEAFTAQGCEVVDLSHDQDSTDLQKCIAHILAAKVDASHGLEILALGALGGRLDHTVSNLSSLIMFRDLDIVLIGEGNTARLLHGGEHTVIAPDKAEGPGCGLVPFGGPARVTTTGLRWNLNDQVMQLGALISTSNEMNDDEEIHVTANSDVLWITEVAK